MDIRWKQRFQNFEKANENLKKMVELFKKEPTNIAYKLACIQAFEMDFELCWKTVKDYLNYLGYKVQSPRETVKQAFSVDIIKDGELFIEMIEARNSTSHIYDEIQAQKVIEAISGKYFEKINDLLKFLQGKLNDWFWFEWKKYKNINRFF